MKHLLKLTIALCLLYGCQKDNSGSLPNNQEETYYSSSAIDSDIRIEMKEVLDSTGRTLHLYGSTTKQYRCCNFGISRTLNISSNKIHIKFNSIIEPYGCLTAIGPARTTIDLGTLANGTYDLEIEVGKNKNSGQLRITPDQYIIIFDKPKQLQIINTPLNKIPANTIWGTVGYHINATEKWVQSFIDSLQVLGATQPNYQPGNYSYFQINSNGQIMPPENHGYYFIHPYIFSYTGTHADIKKLVRNYGINYKESLSITLYTTQGETFMSWIP